MSETNMMNNNKVEELPPLTTMQQEVISFIRNNWEEDPHQNSLCALGVGLGKTRVACEIINILTTRDDFKSDDYTLVCCSTRTPRDTIWPDTLAQYGFKTKRLSGKVFDQVKMKTRKMLTIQPKTVYLITYANLIKSGKDGTPNIEYFKNRPPAFIVFDEFHNLSNSFDRTEQQYRKAVLELPTIRKLGLTATPLVNTEDEMVLAYGLLNDPDLCRSLDVKKNRKPTVEQIRLAKESDFLYFKHTPYSITTCLDWFIQIPIEKQLHTKYKELLAVHTTNDLVNQQNETLRFLVEGEYQRGKKHIIYQGETGKMQALRIILSHINPGDKIVVFDNFTHTLDFIAKQDWIRAFHPVVHHGKKSDNDNKRSYKRFMENEETRVFLTTRSQCAEGINLQIANHVVIMNCWWTAKDLIQMIGRIKRYGQNKPVYSYLLGYNCISLLDKTATTEEDGWLPEELNMYRTVEKKVYTNKIWGMDITEQMPDEVPFLNPDTFEQDFDAFLGAKILKPEPLHTEPGTKTDDAVEKEGLGAKEAPNSWERFYDSWERFYDAFIKCKTRELKFELNNKILENFFRSNQENLDTSDSDDEPPASNS